MKSKTQGVTKDSDSDKTILFNIAGHFLPNFSLHKC